MEQIHAYVAGLKQTLDRLPINTIRDVIELLHEARLQQRHIFILGNGGSASTASHFVCDLAKNTRLDHFPDFRVVGLADNMALLSAYANDEGYENVFANQLASLIRAGDVVIGISTSGKSPNVLRAMEVAQAAGGHTVGFTGFDGGRLASMVQFNVHVPSSCIEHVEDIHLMLEHLICLTLRQQADQLGEIQWS